MWIKRADFESYIRNFRFKELFNDLGWDYVKKTEIVAVDDRTFELEAVAEKRDFLIFVCLPSNNGKIADSAARKRIDHAITKLYFEHLIIYVDSERRTQIWQLSIREPNKPIVRRETTHYTHQAPELLYQRLGGLFFTLEEEDHIGLVDVKQRVSESFTANAEKVTKQFYDFFKKEHRTFLEFIEGIQNTVDREWYASLMLNRMMFIYFIQKKGFLDNDKDYLRNKLKHTQQKRGRNKFYSFYRDFLLVLFHKGLGSPESERAQEIKEEIGKVPYLNGGLFDVHHIEKSYQDIQIDDDAFQGVFDFFDRYEWHLDTRRNASGRDINPDVIGYIFEKYINDRAAMGAYYTKEDITEYISKNCIIPLLFGETKKECANAFRGESSLWKMLRENPDRYIYDAVKHGVKIGLPEDWQQLSFDEKVGAGLPEEIAVGIDTTRPGLLERRRHWNTPAPPEVALPTEIWREVIERRKRYWDVSGKIKSGEIQDINDFVTYNLDIRQFAQDAVEQYEGSDFISAFYRAIAGVKADPDNSQIKPRLGITILDPTCGSGAFLFAALNVLEPLYEGCIQRMREFVEDADAKGGSQKFPQFRRVLADIERHPNLKYYIYKSIILNNLYGVDIMKEAVEIAKLRLFLKLMAEVDNVDQVEPMPDLDFNIRAGNTLVGFATYEELQEAIQAAGLDFGGDAEKFREEAEKVGMAFQRFKDAQLVEDVGSRRFHIAKTDLHDRLYKLNDKLNVYLAKQYGITDLGKEIDVEIETEENGRKRKLKKRVNHYNHWMDTHQPFHWFAEFYEIVHENSGFDVIIGNPPYIEYPKIRNIYGVKHFKTLKCNNLYAYCSEKAFSLKSKYGCFGMILPNSSISATKMLPLHEIFFQSGDLWIANFAWRPSKLFEGADMLLAIVLSLPYNKGTCFTSKYDKWFNDYRDFLFPALSFVDASSIKREEAIPKLPALYLSIHKKLVKLSHREMSDHFSSKNRNSSLYYFRAVQYWIKIVDKEPIYLEDGKPKRTSEMKPIYCDTDERKYMLISILSSSLYFLYYVVWSSCQVINNRDFEFPFDFKLLSFTSKSRLVDLGQRLQEDYQKNSRILERWYSSRGRKFVMRKQHFYIKKSKHIIDEIDRVLAQHYSFTEEELDFIINYDIKYRMGKELNEEE